MTRKLLFCLSLLVCSVFCDTSAALAVTLSDTPPPVPDAAEKRPAVRSEKREVINIIFSKIEDGYIYSKDGKKFHISSNTKIINNLGPSRKIRIAELTFVDGTLVMAIMK